MSTELIERYLRTRRRRYFRGQHDGEFFFILTAGHERLHVHMESSRADGNLVTIRVTPGYFFPATDRARLLQFAAQWNDEDSCARANVHKSTDPNRLGLAAENSCAGQDIEFEDFANFADHTIRSAVDMFRAISPGQPPQQEWLPDAS